MDTDFFGQFLPQMDIQDLLENLIQCIVDEWESLWKMWSFSFDGKWIIICSQHHTSKKQQGSEVKDNKKVNELHWMQFTKLTFAIQNNI